MSMDSLVSKATTKDDNPAPGYVFVELSKLTHADLAVCDKLADALADKCKKPDAAVKWKALVAIKQVARSGRLEFRRSMQRHSDTVKTCLQFKGPMDPLRGDEPNKRVRDAAKDALEAMFDSTVTAANSASAAGSGARIASISSASSAGSPYPPAHKSFPPVGPSSTTYDAPTTSTSSSGMVGFGNSEVKTGDKGTAAGLLGTFTDKMKSAFNATTTVPPPGRGAGSDYSYASNRPGAPGSSGVPAGSSSYTPADVPYAAPASPYTTTGSGFGGGSSAPHASGAHVKGAPGGGWGSTTGLVAPYSAGYVPHSSGGGGGGATPSSPSVPAGRRAFMPAGTAGGMSSSGAGGAATDGAYERGIIEDLTAPGGIRSVPDKVKLNSFLAAVRTLDKDVIGRLLDERLSLALPSAPDAAGAGSSIAVKTLAVIETVATTAGCEDVARHLAHHCDVILELADGADKPTVAAAAARALTALGVEFEGAAAAAAAASAGTSKYNASAAAVAEPLIDIFGSPAPAVSTPSAAPSGGFFAGLSVAPAPAPVSAPAPAPALDIFSNLSLNAPAPAPVPAPAPAPIMASAPGAAAFDVFGMLSAAAPAPAPVLAAPAPAPMPIMNSAPPMMGGVMPGGGSASSMSALQMQLATLNAQMDALMAAARSPAAATDANLQRQYMDQMNALRAQQNALVMALTSLASGGGGMGGGGMPAAPAPATGLAGLYSMPVMGGAPGGFGGMGAPMAPPAAPVYGGLNALGLGSSTPASPARLAASAPAAPKPADTFDFVASEFGK